MSFVFSCQLTTQAQRPATDMSQPENLKEEPEGSARFAGAVFSQFMSDWKRVENVDGSILERITEAEVIMWMAAKLAAVRGTLPASCISVMANFRKYGADEYYDVNWGMHAADKYTGTQPDTACCVKRLKEELLDNPKSRAEEARRKAKQLLKEAEELEALQIG